MLAPAITGFGTGMSLIVAIGAQNAFVLRQGLIQQHVFWVCLISAVSDAVLIAAGVTGMGGITSAAPWILRTLIWAGELFLIFYGVLSILRALKSERLVAAGKSAVSLQATLLTCLALAWLNPHVYFDTIGLIGTISTQYEASAGKIAFALGAMGASFIFFFGLGYGARFLAPVFAKARAWAILEIIIAGVMWTIAASLISTVL